MKKLYAFLVAVMAVLGMNAQDTLYVVGSGVGLDWTPATPKAVVKADNAFTFTVENLVQFKISTVKGTWDEYNAGALCAEVGKDQLGTAVELTAGDGNIGTPWPGDYTVVVSGDLKTITMTTTTAEPTGPATFYLRGGMNSWGSDDAWKFTQKEGNTYTLTCAIPEGTEFKVADANWGAINYGAGDLVFVGDATEWNYNAENAVMGEEFEGIVTVVLPEVAKKPISVAFEADASVGNVAVDNAAAEYFNLQGVRVANPQNGMFIVRQGAKVTKVIK